MAAGITNRALDPAWLGWRLEHVSRILKQRF
jgi:hypothetical protein